MDEKRTRTSKATKKVVMEFTNDAPSGRKRVEQTAQRGPGASEKLVIQTIRHDEEEEDNETPEMNSQEITDSDLELEKEETGKNDEEEEDEETEEEFLVSIILNLIMVL